MAGSGPACTGSGPCAVSPISGREKTDMDVVSLKLSPRAVMGKKVKQLRRQGMVPVHLYGQGLEPQSLQVEAQVLRRVLPQVGTNVPLSIELDGQNDDNICFVREVQRHPVTEDLLHVDFMRVDVARTIRSDVPIVVEGNAPAVRDMGGTLLQQLQTVEVESLPMNVPTSFQVDVSGLDDFEKGLYVRDLEVGADVTILTDPDDLIARVSQPRVEAVEEEVEAEAAEGEGPEAPVAEGEAGA